MQRLTLNGTNIMSSPLGFGCMSLTLLDNHDRAVRLLEDALDAGITHFDVARAYGFGQAEGILGSFLAGKRDRVTVATKFGQQPKGVLTKSRRLISIARWAAHRSKAILKLGRRIAKKSVSASAFDSTAAKRSLETSLRELRTDYVDILFLHECVLADAVREELIAFLDSEVAKGRIRNAGTATWFRALQGNAALWPSRYNVMQFDHSVLKPNIPSLLNAQDRGIITFAAVSPAKHLAHAANRSPALLKKYRERIDIDVSDTAAIATLMLQGAVSDNPRGITLFASTNPTHIRSNVEALQRPIATAARLGALREFAAEAEQAR